ncbi:head-tail joining protein [Stakelama tenebrarum]|uniref:Uncharacterized protein n=1 Tax=Stakelama tenebrarum TaxID=2711215 RepID=A0A6G6Y5Y2_9SPHN|nr:hypothetical protein [Sphingosinithalassobacter tenebrarum]QIG79986.1 hypothetical protein G5C33_09495 [Sphingosinithalassobacter tenebrarum]
MIDAVFRQFGEDARWAGGDVVRVRRKVLDSMDDVAELNLISRREELRVRQSEVASPARGDVVALVDADGVATGEEWTVSGEPVLDRNRVWHMPFRVTAEAGV